MMLLHFVAILISVLSASLEVTDAAAAFVAHPHHHGETTGTISSSSATTNDWIQAELTLQDFPRHPSPSLSPERVARVCLRSLQLVNHPYELAGLSRIFPFLTWQCIRHVTPPSECHGKANHDDDDNDEAQQSSEECFCQQAVLSPVLQPFMGATRIEFDEEHCTISPGTKTRGDIISYRVAVYPAPMLAFAHKSGMLREGVVADGPPRVDMVIRLCQEQRPPLAGCWLVRDIVDVRFATGGIGWSRDEGV